VLDGYPWLGVRYRPSGQMGWMIRVSSSGFGDNVVSIVSVGVISLSGIMWSVGPFRCDWCECVTILSGVVVQYG